jgi:hypothetical protein
MKGSNPSPIHYENNIPRGSAPRYVDSWLSNGIPEIFVLSLEENLIQ